MIYLKDSATTYKVSQYKDSAIIATIDNVTGATEKQNTYLVTLLYPFESYAFHSLRKAQQFIRDNINNMGPYPVIINKDGQQWLSYNNHCLGTLTRVKRGNRLYWYNHRIGFIDGSYNRGQLLQVVNEIISKNNLK